MAQEDRLHSRENSTLVFATVAASASLLILTFVLQNFIPPQVSWIAGFGFAFSILGPLYREVTIFTIDLSDYRRIGRRDYQWWEVIPRMITIRFFLFLPIAAWFIFFTSSACLWTTVIFTLVVACLLSVIEWMSRNQHVHLQGEPTRREREEAQPPQREEVHDRFQRIDRLFDVILVLVTVLAAAELQYASVAFMENPDPNRTFILKLNSLSFTFRVLTISIIFLIFIWLGKEFFQNENRRMFMRELCWTFAIYTFLLELLVFWVLTFVAIDMAWFITGASIPLTILLGLVMREYHRLAPDLEYLRWRGLMFWEGSIIAIAVSYITIEILVLMATSLLTPIPV